MMLVRELSERDCENRRLMCKEMQQHVPRAAFVIFSDEAHLCKLGQFTCVEMSAEKMSVICRKPTHVSFKNGPFVVLLQPYGVVYQRLVFVFLMF